MPNTVTILIIVLGYHSAALAGLLVWRTRLRALPLFFAVLAVHMGANLVESGGADIAHFTGAIGILYGPLFYLFVREAAMAEQPLRWADAWIAIPFAIMLLLPAGSMTRALFASVVTVASLVAAAVTLMRFRASALQIRATPDLTRMDWLTWAVAGFVLLVGFDLVRSLWRVSDSNVFSITLAGLVLLTSLLAAGAVGHARRGGPLASEERAAAKPGQSVPRAELETWFASIEAAISADKLYLSPGLKLADLAAASGLTAREASQAINACFGENFSSYINRYRARHARDLLEQAGERRTLMEIALESGFNSKTAFNEFFKRETGVAPSVFAGRRRSQS